MKRIGAVFELTVPEQRVILVLLLALIALVAIEDYRDSNRHRPPSVAAAAEDQPSPSPGILP